MISSEREPQVIALCQALIRHKSYSGAESGAVHCMRQAFESFGFDQILVDEYGSVLGCIKGKRPGPVLLFDGHIDTVPVPDASVWKHDPYGGELATGRIYGRGASDMKGAVTAMLTAAAFFGADTRRDFQGEVWVSGVVHEERFEGVAARRITERIQPGLVVIGEASELNLKRGQRGRAELVVETFGKPAHSANPRAGINAVYAMTTLIDAMRSLPVPAHPVLGEGILELTDIKSSPYPGASVVPDYCRATYDRRLLVGETPASVLAPIQSLLETIELQDPQFKAAVQIAAGVEPCYTGARIQGQRFFPGWLFEESHAYVQAVLKGLRSAGLHPQITQYSFCTNGSHYAGEAGIPTVGFGPSRESLAHTIDEYIEVDQLLRAAAGYYGILSAVLCEATGA